MESRATFTCSNSFPWLLHSTPLDPEELLRDFAALRCCFHVAPGLSLLPHCQASGLALEWEVRARPASLAGDTECPHQVLLPPTSSYQFLSHSKINGIKQTFPGVTRELSGSISPECDLYSHCAHKSSVTVTSMQSDHNWTQAVS